MLLGSFLIMFKSSVRKIFLSSRSTVTVIYWYGYKTICYINIKMQSD